MQRLIANSPEASDHGYCSWRRSLTGYPELRSTCQSKTSREGNDELGEWGWSQSAGKKERLPLSLSNLLIPCCNYRQRGRATVVRNASRGTGVGRFPAQAGRQACCGPRWPRNSGWWGLGRGGFTAAATHGRLGFQEAKTAPGNKAAAGETSCIPYLHLPLMNAFLVLLQDNLPQLFVLLL